MLFRIFQVQVYISKKLIILFCRVLLSCCHQVTALCLDTRQPAILIHMHCYLAMIQNSIVIMTGAHVNHQKEIKQIVLNLVNL